MNCSVFAQANEDAELAPPVPRAPRNFGHVLDDTLPTSLSVSEQQDAEDPAKLGNGTEAEAKAAGCLIRQEGPQAQQGRILRQQESYNRPWPQRSQAQLPCAHPRRSLIRQRQHGLRLHSQMAGG